MPLPPSSQAISSEDRDQIPETAGQDDEEYEQEDEQISEHAKLLKRLDDHEGEIRNLQMRQDLLAQQIAARNRTTATLEALRQAEIRRNRLLREIELLQAGSRVKDDVVILGANVAGYEAIDMTSSLSAKIQRHPWPSSYKPRLPAFDGKSNPKKFIASYEAAVHSVGGNSTTLAKSLIMDVEDVHHHLAQHKNRIVGYLPRFSN